MDVVAVTDVGAAARDAGLPLRETVLLVWSDGATITPIISAAPLSAFDLPPRVLVWADALETKVTHLTPEAFAARYGLGVELVAGLACIADIVDVVIDR